LTALPSLVNITI